MAGSLRGFAHYYLPGSTICFAEKFFFVMCWIKSSQLFFPISNAGSATVLKPGEMRPDTGSFVNPITPTSSPIFK